MRKTISILDGSTLKEDDDVAADKELKYKNINFKKNELI